MYEGPEPTPTDDQAAPSTAPSAASPAAPTAETQAESSLPALQRAVRYGDAARCREILRDNADLATAPSARGGSLLLEAFEREEQGISDLFLEARNDRGITELDVHEASAMGRPGIVQKRLTDDPLVYEEVGPAGFLPLHRAVYRAHVDPSSLLLQMGADPNARSENGASLTALHSALAGAARFGDEGGRYRAVVERLLAAGADPTLEMEGGWTPLGTAERDGLSDIAAMLRGASSSAAPAAENALPVDAAPAADEA